MISIVVPTRNREHTLRKVASSYFAQEGVDEIIVVDDEGHDGTLTFLRELGAQYPDVDLLTISNLARRGASACRNIGASAAKNAYVLFVDDDEYLEQRYAVTCLEKLRSTNAGAVSGRRVYMLGHETQDQARARFGTGMRHTRPFNRWTCEYVNGARYDGDIEMPLTNAIILTERSLVLANPFDEFYNRGNGYREESDYQMNIYLKGRAVLVTNATHSFHLPIEAVRTGGQRTNRWKRVYWSVFFTRYFYGKYFTGYREKVGLPIDKRSATAIFVVFVVYKEFVRPSLYALVMRLRRQAPRRSPT